LGVGKDRKMNIKTKEFLIDTLARANQIIFTILVIGPFVSGFNIVLFVFGLVFYTVLLAFGITIARSIKEEE
jgi:ABC-type Na+ efflux pump permease subunit